MKSKEAEVGKCMCVFGILVQNESLSEAGGERSRSQVSLGMSVIFCNKGQSAHAVS